MRRVSTLLLSLALAAGCAGSVQVVDGWTIPAGAHPPSRSERAASFAPLRSERAGASTLAALLVTATACLMSSDPDDPDEAHIGSAAAIASDGYLLTAAHCLSLPRVHLRVHTPSALTWTAARVVWRPADGEPDLALLKVDVPLAAALAWAGASDVTVGAEVASAGFGMQPLRPLEPMLTGGRVLALSPGPRGAAAPVILVTTSTPAVFGDSGGPVTTRTGRLVGIFVAGWETVPAEGDGAFARGSDALRPEAAWVERLIAEDRAAHAPR